MAELGRDQRLELVGEDVLEHLRLLVHTVPRHPERLREVGLQQPVVAEHAQRDAAALGRELDAVIAPMRHEAVVVEAAQHGRSGGGGDPQTLGHGGRGDGPSDLGLEREDRLRVVLHSL
jgi:hypothetical protein